jgi:hypothetical protein
MIIGDFIVSVLETMRLVWMFLQIAVHRFVISAILVRGYAKKVCQEGVKHHVGMTSRRLGRVMASFAGHAGRR